VFVCIFMRMHMGLGIYIYAFFCSECCIHFGTGVLDTSAWAGVYATQVCFYANVHICKHTRCRLCTFVYIYTFVYMHAYVYGMYACIGACVYVCMCICVCLCICIHTHARVGAHMHSCRRILFICIVQSLCYMHVYHRCFLTLACVCGGGFEVVFFPA